MARVEIETYFEDLTKGFDAFKDGLSGPIFAAPKPLPILRVDIPGTEGDDNPLDGTEDDDTINGLGGNDVINGLGGNDIINGGDGDDIIEGGAGRDTINGDAGNDIFLVTEAGTLAGDIYNGGSGTDTIDLSVLTVDITMNLDNNDFFGIKNQSFAETSGGGIARAFATKNHILGSGNDFIVLTDGRNVFAGAGDDLLHISSRGHRNGDIYDGGLGTDTLDLTLDTTRTYTVDLTTNTLVTGVRTATLTGIEHVNGNEFDDVITGNTFMNILTGNGGDGNDTLDGGDGRDLLIGGEGEDLIFGGADTDFLRGGAARDRMFGGDQSDRMFGQDGNDIMDGGGSNDIMFGGGNARYYVWRARQ